VPRPPALTPSSAGGIVLGLHHEQAVPAFASAAVDASTPPQERASSKDMHGHYELLIFLVDPEGLSKHLFGDAGWVIYEVAAGEHIPSPAPFGAPDRIFGHSVISSIYARGQAAYRAGRSSSTFDNYTPDT
jgi:hypothetical protein